MHRFAYMCIIIKILSGLIIFQDIQKTDTVIAIFPLVVLFDCQNTITYICSQKQHEIVFIRFLSFQC